MSDMAVYALGDLADVQTGPFGSQLHSSDYVNEGTPIITVEHLTDDGSISHDRIPLVSEADRARLLRYSLRVGDLVFSRVGAIDRCSYVSPGEDGWLFSGRLLRVRPDFTRVNSRFLKALLSHESTQRWIKNHAVGSTMPCLNTSILKHVPVRLPHLSEQRQIAEILDTADEVIRSTDRLIAKQTALTAQLAADTFTGLTRFNRGAKAGGQVVGNWEYGRLPGIQTIPADWRLVRLVDYARLESGHTPSRDIPAYWNGNVPWLSLHDTSTLDQHIISATQYYVTMEGINNSSARLLPEGTVAFSRTATVGKCVILGRVMATSQDFACYICGPEVLNRYLLHLFRQMQSVWRSLASGSTHQTVYMPIFERLQVLLPPVEEQIRIADALDAADQALDSLRSVGAKQRNLKGGLMDDLLTGRVRVRDFS